MTDTVKEDSWVWIVVQDPEVNDQIVGLEDDEPGVYFIPTFKTKEIALQFFVNMPRETGHKYEAQAIIYEDLDHYASENTFLIYMLDADGKVLDKITPSSKNTHKKEG